jgi:hypothetical protein
MKDNGYLLHEGTTNGQPYVVIATGITKPTDNSKTGDMIQIWIMLKDVHPAAGVRSGLDATTICTGCPFAAGNGCYVNVNFAPAGIWKKYQRAEYPYLAPRDYHIVFGGRKVRFGAYGNPTLIPFSIAKAIAKASDGWTGYYHNWATMSHREARQWNTLFMASTETQSSLKLAQSLNLRTFHVSTEKPEGFIECLSDSHGISCAKCLLCSGLNKPAKPIWINPHGFRTKKAVKQINQ